MSFENFIAGYGNVVHRIAEFAVYTLEFIGILIIILGTINAVAMFFDNIIKKHHANIVISLGRSLALALEFKMGAEIINTVIVRDLEELGILAIVVAIRALLAFLIHWEIKAENKKSKEEVSDK
jgi:uncharacterized membrane protein